MPYFTYQAYDLAGKQRKGVVQADSEKQAVKQLKDEALFVKNIQLSQDKNTRKKSLLAVLMKRKINQAELALILRQAGILLKSGLPLDNALKLLEDQADNARQRNLVAGWRVEIMQGRSFSASMRKSGYSFPESILAGIAVGEETGNLHEVLLRLAEELEVGSKNRQAFQRGLMYPATLLIASVFAIGFIMVFVVPKISAVFSGSKMELPVITKVVVTCSRFVEAYWPYMLMLVIILIIGFFAYVNDIVRRRRWHQLQLKIPGFKHWVQMSNLGDWSRSLGLMLSSGVPVLSALKISSSVMNNTYMQWQMEQVSERLRKGSSLHDALKKEGAASAFLLHMVGSGETASELDTMLLRVSEYYSARLISSVDSFLKIMNPVLTMGMGFLVLVIILSVMLPIMNINESIG